LESSLLPNIGESSLDTSHEGVPKAWQKAPAEGMLLDEGGG